MVFDDRVSGRVTLGGIVLAVFLAAVALPGFMLGDRTADAQDVSTSSASSADVPGEARSPSTSSAATESESESTENGKSKYKYSRATSLKRLIKNDEITGEKSAEISLGSGGIIRISKNEQGDLIVTVEQTETSSDARPGKSRATSVIVGTPQTTQIGGLATGTASARTVRKRTATGIGSATSFPRSIRRTEETAGSSDDSGSAAEFDRRLLASDVELAQVSLLEKRAELEIAKKDKVDEPRLNLAELAVRRAEIELARAKLRLSQGSRGAAGR
jgi:hypothetical protein